MRERPDDLAGVQPARGVEGVLDRLEGAHEARAEHALVELRARDAVAVLAGVRALEAADELEGLLGDRAHRPDVRPARLRSRIGRTCRQPTEAWAYQVPRVPWRAKSR